VDPAHEADNMMFEGSYQLNFVQRWSPKVGQRAARLQLLSSRILGLSSFAFIASMIILGVLHKDSHGVVFHAVLVVIAILAVVFLYGLFLRHRMFKAMSTHLGVHVWFLNSPDYREERFSEWCRRNGISPDA
jgi:hypothetical protein